MAYVNTFLARRNIHIQGRLVPGIIIDEPVTENVTTSRGKVIPSQFATMISLREPNPDGEFAGQPAILRMTRENIAFTSLREKMVQGLDVDENGALLTLVELERMRAKDLQELQVRNLARQRAVAVPLGDANSLVSDLDAADEGKKGKAGATA